ncbi:uncharacterized protein B0P05DRAFT_594865 [Gilbertella persicaria]|uniref:uncharacterized protein n=1 Tax=Gilbertella persicaria TaxID=101096 RepID=UPI00221ED64E|nr:uncharacterized protein B0P05DRAFT_594865 [Gilbertella persicaria]KAI8087603.1 hypothetical protein B0P05DRAFT_594865 [Gilbertella persicaria]
MLGQAPDMTKSVHGRQKHQRDKDILHACLQNDQDANAPSDYEKYEAWAGIRLDPAFFIPSNNLMSKQSRRILEELSLVTEDRLLLQAAIDRQTIRRLQNEAEGIEQSTTKKQKKTISKKKYFQNLTKNQVTDFSISTHGSHIDGLSKVQVKRLHKNKNVAYENNNINSLSIKFKKIVNSGKLKVALNSCEKYKPTTPVEHVVNRIYLFVLRAHVEKPWVFSSENLKRYSEFDLQFTLSFVSSVRGDTMSSTCKNVGLRFKLDLRILILRGDETVVDGATGEIARKATKAKLYSDRLKSVLTTKYHLNAFLKSLIHIRRSYYQFMGLEAKVSSLRLIGKKQYVMEDLHSFKFPRTSAQLKSGELESLINGLTLIEELVNSLETKFNDGQTEKESSMDRILKETKKKKKMILKEWLSDVTWDANDEESDDEESEEDSDEESESDSDNQGINDETTDNDLDEE